MFRIVNKCNAPWRQGTWFDCADGYCQMIHPHTDQGGRVASHHTEGLMLPEKQVIPWTVGLVKQGLDMGGIRKG